MGVHWKILFLGGVHKIKKTIFREDCVKRGFGQFADLQEGLAKKRVVVFFRGLIPQCTPYLKYNAEIMFYSSACTVNNSALV